MAFLFSFAMALINLDLMTGVGFMMRNSLMNFYFSSGRRLQFLQEVVAGIREVYRALPRFERALRALPAIYMRMGHAVAGVH